MDKNQLPFFPEAFKATGVFIVLTILPVYDTKTTNINPLTRNPINRLFSAPVNCFPVNQEGGQNGLSARCSFEINLFLFLSFSIFVFK